MRTIAAWIPCVLMVALLAVPGPAAAAPPAAGGIDSPALDAFITGQMDKHGLKGVSLAVTQGDQILYLHGYGLAGKDRPMTPQTPMYIGSQSKSFTALAAAQLAAQGKISLAAPVRQYIPWFAVADPAASEKITVSDLLHHTSGLSDAGYRAVVADEASLEQGVRALSAATLTAPVGEKFQYFNLNYSVLMLVIETVTGQKYADFIQQNVIAPLQMERTYTDPAAARSNGLSQGYSRIFGFTVAAPQPHPAYQLGNGYLISTAEDMAHFAIAMNNQGSYHGNSVLPAEKTPMLFAPLNGYGMGWFVEPGHIYHGGANETFKTFVDLYPGRGLGIVLLINQGYMLDHTISAGQVFNGVAAIVLGNQPPALSAGWSVRVIGWALLGLVLALCALHTWNILHLRGWTERARRMSPARRAWDVAVSFIIPTVILLVVYTQVKGFFGSRFNLAYQLGMVFRALPDISVLLLVGSVPDYFQGLVKLYWVLAGKTGKAVSKPEQRLTPG